MRRLAAVSRAAGATLAGTGLSDFVVCALDGREVRINLSGAPMGDGEGHIVGGVQVLRNVSARHPPDQRTRDCQSVLEMAEMAEMAETVVSDGPGAEGQPTGRVAAMARRLADLTRTVVGCRWVGVVTAEPATGTLRIVATATVTPEQEAAWRANWRTPQYPAAQATSSMPPRAVRYLALADGSDTSMLSIFT